MRIGDVLGLSVQILRENLLSFLVLAGLTTVPGIAYAIWADAAPSLEVFDRAQGTISAFASWLISPFVIGAITYGVVQQLGGKPASLKAVLVKGGVRAAPVFMVGIVQVLLVIIGTLLLVVPGAVLACMYFVAIPAAVVEQLGVGEALSRSGLLTKGYKVKIFALVALQVLLFVGLAFVGVLVLYERVETIGELRAGLVLFELATIPVVAFGAVLAAVSYYELRRAKEGTSAEELAHVFE